MSRYQVVTSPEWLDGKVVSGFKSLALTWDDALNVAKRSWGDEVVIVPALGNTPLAYFPEVYEDFWF